MLKVTARLNITAIRYLVGMGAGSSEPPCTGSSQEAQGCWRLLRAGKDASHSQVACLPRAATAASHPRLTVTVSHPTSQLRSTVWHMGREGGLVSLPNVPGTGGSQQHGQACCGEGGGGSSSSCLLSWDWESNQPGWAACSPGPTEASKQGGRDPHPLIVRLVRLTAP